MEVRTTTKGRELIVSLCGELDHHAARETVTAIERAAEAAMPARLTLDFGGVSFMDSSGIAVAVRVRRRMAALGGGAELVNVPPQAKKVFDAAAIERALDAALPSALAVDFGGVTFMDSSGIAVAMRAMRRMAALGGRSSLINVPPQAKRVFDAAGIICTAKEEAT